jgi:hypothetical protein
MTVWRNGCSNIHDSAICSTHCGFETSPPPLPLLPPVRSSLLCIVNLHDITLCEHWHRSAMNTWRYIISYINITWIDTWANSSKKIMNVHLLINRPPVLFVRGKFRFHRLPVPIRCNCLRSLSFLYLISLWILSFCTILSNLPFCVQWICFSYVFPLFLSVRITVSFYFLSSSQYVHLRSLLHELLIFSWSLWLLQKFISAEFRTTVSSLI